MLSHENDILHQCHFCLWFRANGYIDFLRRCEKLEIYFQLERGKATQWCWNSYFVIFFSYKYSILYDSVLRI